MTTCHGCTSPIEPLAAIRTYHSGCDPKGRVEMLEKALRTIAEKSDHADRYFRDQGEMLIADHCRGAAETARAALEYRPAQMKGREE